ncbi:MAG: efflux RND transporter periplasmic adaptor subunit [Rhodospirillales bacterium]|nr:efflux RND transporter periplasmic adaptor subunit [Rhodospirillales bacterium]
MRFRIYRPLSALVLLLFLAPALSVPSLAQKKDQAAMVGIDLVRSEPLSQTVPVIGRLVARQAGVVAARIKGPVAELRVNVGDHVNKGDIIAVLVKDYLQWEHRLRQAEVSQAEAKLKTAKAQVILKTQEMDRFKGLSKSAAFSQARLDDASQEVVKAKSVVGESEAALLQSQANQKLAEISLYNADIRAPYPAVVSQRLTEVGAYLNVGQPVVFLIDDQNLEIEADVPAKRIPGLIPGTKVSFSLGTQDTFTAKVRAVVPEENPLTRTRAVRFIPDFNGGIKNLASNQSVTLLLPAGEIRDVVTVHKDAILNRKGQNIVFIVEDGTANIRPVQLGEAAGTRFVVERGLKPGDVVVIRGNERLRPGQKVSPKKKPGT